MPPPAKFANPLEASSYHHPNGGEAYAPLRQQVVQTATAMGYDPTTMTEHGVVWADDQDPFGHVMGAAYPHYFAVCNFRVFESFETQLKDKYEDLFKARGIGVITKTYTVDLLRPVTYPDSVLFSILNFIHIYADNSLEAHHRQSSHGNLAGPLLWHHFRLVLEAAGHRGRKPRLCRFLRLQQGQASEPAPGRGRVCGSACRVDKTRCSRY